MEKKFFKHILFFFILLNNIFNIFPSNNSYKNIDVIDLIIINQDKKQIIIKDSLFMKDYKTALSLYKKNMYAEALKKSFPLYEKSKKQDNLIFSYLISSLIGDIYYKTNNYDKSLTFYKKAIVPFRKRTFFDNDFFITKGDSINYFLGKTYLQIGSLYQKKYVNDKKSELNLKDSAIYYYTKLENLDTNSKKVLRYKAVSYYNLSGIFQRDTLYKKAVEYALKAVNIHKENNDKINWSSSLNNLGNVYISSKEFKKAKDLYLEGINLIENNNSQKSVKVKANLYYNLAWAMRNLKDYKAYDYQELSYEIEDSQREKEIRKIIEEVTTNHKENLEQQKINLVKEQRKLEETQQAKTTLLFGALSLLVIVISGVVIYNYKLRQSNLQLKLSESDLLQQQSIEKLKSDAQIKILNATIDGKETERKQIAETLHDNVSALLSSANMHLSATKKQFNGDTPQEIEKTRQIILEASQKVRDLSHNLISSILLKFGLEYALKDVVKKYSNSELKFEVKANNINRYNQEFEIKIFNVIQELINNIIKHSNASNAEIILKVENNQLTILVKDDGVGFATSSSSINDGIGLNQIEARIKMMNGKLAIDSEPDKGTEVFILVPIQQQKEYGSLSSVS